MMTEAELKEATQLVARHHRLRRMLGTKSTISEQIKIQRRLEKIGVTLDFPINDPKAPA